MEESESQQPLETRAESFDLVPDKHPSSSCYWPNTVIEVKNEDATLPCYLSPETSAVTMEIRWFKWIYCIYQYKNGEVREGRGYEGRVSLIMEELQRGNVSLTLRDVQRADEGKYRCMVLYGEDKKVTSETLLEIYVNPVEMTL
ncbi:butyrophilin subfamily 1 member A1-like [Chanos chanos]|uniref:Butyrophilin subfamily 1 member A1-like n=1 Tax=Chanos chanos TaxID=29144 RepID=A0A6J2V2W9_CHACN|nr:butyrophilin subfamily 1 member A1-like [Chanos chanos]